MLSYTNALLRTLDSSVVARLHLHPITLDLQTNIEVPGTPVRSRYFLEQGMASMTTAFSDGTEVEVGMFGFESVIGVSALMGTVHSLNRVFMQVGGSGYRCSLNDGAAEFRRGEAFQRLALRYVQAQLVQTMQSTGCNAKHEMEQRLARWLLLCADRTNSTSFIMPQEFMAQMLGARRTTVTTAAIKLKNAGLIKYSRGRLVLLDIAGLEARACECYSVIRDHLHSLTEFDTSLVA